MILWLLGGTTVVAVLGFLVASVQIILALRDQGGSPASAGHPEEQDLRALASGTGDRMFPTVPTQALWGHVAPTPPQTDPVVPEAPHGPATWSIGLPSAAVPKGFTPPVDYVNDLMPGTPEPVQEPIPVPQRPSPPTWEAQHAPTSSRPAQPIRSQPVAPEAVAEKDDFVPVIVRDIFLIDEDEDR